MGQQAIKAWALRELALKERAFKGQDYTNLEAKTEEGAACPRC
jgi:hypothetical protein